MRFLTIALFTFLCACVSTSVGGKRKEKGGEDEVDSYCVANCADRGTDGACTKFHASAAETCKEYLHDEDE